MIDSKKLSEQFEDLELTATDLIIHLKWMQSNTFFYDEHLFSDTAKESQELYAGLDYHVIDKLIEFIKDSGAEVDLEAAGFSE